MAFLSVQAQKVRHSVSGSGLGKLITGQHKPESPAELYYMYKDEFGYFPKEPHHLVSFGTKKSYKIGHAKAEDVIFDPPDPPKGRLPNGGFIWSDDDESEMEDSEVSEDSNNSFDTESDMSQEDRGDKWGPQHHSSTVHSAWESQRSETNLSSHQEIKPRSQFSKVKRAQLVRVGWVLPATSMSHYVIPYSQTLKKGNREHSLDVEEIDDLILYDSSGYGLYPFTDRLILRFHLNFPAKQWKKASKVFLTAFNNLLRVKRKDYNVLTIVEHERKPKQCRIAIMLRRLNPHWPSHHSHFNEVRTTMSRKLAPLKKTFQDSKYLLKMLKKLQFVDLDPEGTGVERHDFDTYFTERAVEPLDPQVLTNLFNTLDEDGDGEITALEFFRWKTTFSANKLTQMFPICSWKLSDAYDNVVDRKIFQGFKELKEHCYQHLQNFPFEMNLEHLHLVTHPVKHEKFRMMKNYKSSRLLFLVHKVGIAEGDLHELLKLAVGKSGKYFNGKGMYGQGYYLTSHIEYALNEVFYGETSEFAPNVVDDEDEESKLDDQDIENPPEPEPEADEAKDDEKGDDEDSKENSVTGSKKGKKQKFSKKDLKDDPLQAHSCGEYTVIACLVNAGNTAILTDYDRGKKLKKGIDSNKIERIIGDYNHKLFGAPEAHYYADPEDEDAEHDHDDGYHDGYYKGNIYDCYVIKDHMRIMPRYILTFKRIKQCFIWMGERFEDIKQAATKLIKAREDIKRMMPNLIYAGDRYEKVLKLVKLKMQYNAVFLVRFVGVDINAANQIKTFLHQIRGRSSTVKVKIYPVTIIYNVTTNKQIWSLILRDDKTKKCQLVRGTAKQMFNYVRENLGGPRFMKSVNSIQSKGGVVSALLITLRFVKTEGAVKHVIKEQIEHARDLEEDMKNEAEIVIDADTQVFDDKEYDSFYDGDSDDNKEEEKEEHKRRGSHHQREEEAMRRMLRAEKVERLMKTKLPPEVEDILQEPRKYELPSDLKTLDKDLEMITEGLADLDSSERKWSKLALIKWWVALSAVYDRYCRIGGDRYWLNMEGFLWMMRDGQILDHEACSEQSMISLFRTTYNMHHAAASSEEQASKKLHAQFEEDFGDDDPWSGIWRDDGMNTETYKFRQFGEIRIRGCINDMENADISGTFNMRDPSKAELVTRYHQRSLAGTKRVWYCELIAPDNESNPIQMKITWKELDAQKPKTGKFVLTKEVGLEVDDSDLPKAQFIGLSRHMFCDAILSVASNRYGVEYEAQYECVDVLLSNHIDAHIYKNIKENETNTMTKNKQIKTKIKDSRAALFQCYEHYAALDFDAEDDEGIDLDVDEWCTFAENVLKEGQMVDAKLWSKGGRPHYDDLRAAWLLSRNDDELEETHLKFEHFERMVVNLAAAMFKYDPTTKYETMSYQKKLDMVLAWTARLAETRKTRSDTDRKALTEMRSTRALSSRRLLV